MNKIKYIVLEWDYPDYGGGRNSIAHTFESKDNLLDFLSDFSSFVDLDIYEVIKLKALKAKKVEIILETKR